jgi:hypothetical protein
MTSARTFGVDERRARLAWRHRLLPDRRIDDVATIADDLVALHSSDPVTVYLSATARMAHPSLNRVAEALYDDRSVVRLHAMRRTLWVLTPEHARLAHAAATVGLLEPERRRTIKVLEDHGVADGAQWLRDAERRTLAAVERIGPATARQIGEAVPELRMPLDYAVGKSYAGTMGAHTRVLLLLGFAGSVVRVRPTGTWINGAYRYAAMESWLPGGVTGRDPVTAAAELAARWLVAFGPATTADLRWWMGWAVRKTERALADAGAVAVDVGGAPAWVAPGDEHVEIPAVPWVAILPGLDPTTMGWKQRDWYVDPEHVPFVFDTSGNGGPTVWVDGRIVGGWTQRKDGTIAYRLLTDVGHEAQSAIDEAAHDLERLIGDTRFSTRFPGPIQRELLA